LETWCYSACFNAGMVWDESVAAAVVINLGISHNSDGIMKDFALGNIKKYLALILLWGKLRQHLVDWMRFVRYTCDA